MKIGIATVAYREERFIRSFINHYKNHVDEILVLNSSKPWNGTDEALGPDFTASIATELGATVIRRDWRDETLQRNFGLEYFNGFDWVLILDPDEYFTINDFFGVKEVLRNSPERAFTTGTMLTYWKQGYRIFPTEPHNPIVAIRPGSTTFSCNRGIGSTYSKLPRQYPLHHFSWARTDSEVMQKITHFAHAKEFNVLKWFNDKWKTWTPESRDFHPTHPSQYQSVVKSEVPEELKHLEEF